MGITAEEAQAAGLSQAEIDAINGVDADQDDAALAEIAGDDNDEEGDDASDESGSDEEDGDEGDDDAGDNADDGDAAGSGADDGAGDDGDDGAGGDAGTDLFTGIEEFDVPFVPQLTGELLPQFAQATEKAYDDAAAALDAIEGKFQEGELDADERRAEIRKIERERDAEIRKINAANTNAEIQGQKWDAEQKAFFKANQGYAQPLLFNALNAEVMRIASLPEAAGKSGMQILQAAKRCIDQQLAAVTGGKLPDADKQKQKQADGKPKAKRPDVQTLGGVPAAAAADTGNDKWAHIDKLTGLAYEQALSKMSEAEQAAYLASR